MDDGWYLEAEATVGLLTATGSPRTSYRPLPSHAPADGGASRAAETARATLERLVEADESAVTALVDDLSEITADQPDLLVVVGDMALIEGTRRGLGETPILPVETTPSLQGVAVTDLEAAIAGLEGGSGRIRHQPTLTVESETASARAVFDVTVVTSEPARISEFCLQSRGRTVAQFRADGVIVASPAGSHGYAAAASGSAVEPSIPAVSVVPIAPFVTRTRHWVLPPDDLTITVERDEGHVDVCADQYDLETVGLDGQVDIGKGPALTLLETPLSDNPFPEPPG